MRDVKTAFLLQSLSKEVLAKRGIGSKDPLEIRRQARNAASARNRSIASTTTSSSTSLTSSTSITTPLGDMDVDLEDIVLSDSGAAGAFVHGLEDEFFEVRMAAVDSICELSLRSEHLGGKALEYLVGILFFFTFPVFFYFILFYWLTVMWDLNFTC